MGECPFCAREVDEDLLTFGGPCPNCFGDIPGEEAATDPGEEVKARQAAQDRRRSAFKALLPVLLALPILFGLGLGAIWYSVLRPEPEIVVMDFDEFEDYPMPEFVARAPSGDDSDDGVASAGSVAGTPAPAKTLDASKFTTKTELGSDEVGGTADALAGQAAAATATTTQGTRSGTAEVADGPSLGGSTASASSQQAGLDFGLEVNTARRGAVLEDPDAIRKMIGQRMASQAPRLNRCYENQLKSNESLQGRWRVSFTVTSDGTVSGVGAEGLNESVGAFESCLSNEVARWKFQRIIRDQPVRKTFTFRPAN